MDPIVWMLVIDLTIFFLFGCGLYASHKAIRGKPLYGAEWRRHHRMNNWFGAFSIGGSIAFCIYDFVTAKGFLVTVGFVQLGLCALLVWVNWTRARNFWNGVRITQHFAEHDLIRRLEEGP